ncbi:MAG: HepT-like ribonuclease domain-containing protein [bacterium]
MTSPGPPDAALRDVLNCLRRLSELGAGQTRDTLPTDRMRYESALYTLIVLGEAVKRVPPMVRQQHPEIPWNLMAGQRDILIHRYDETDIPLVLNAVLIEAPRLTPLISAILGLS